MNLSNHSGLRIGPKVKRLRAEWQSRIARRLVEDEGFSRRDVAEFFGLSLKTVATYAVPRMTAHQGGRESGSHEQRRRKARARRQRARRLLELGWGIEDIALKLNVQPDTVEDYFKRGGRV